MKKSVLIVVVGMALAGCQGVENSLGLGKENVVISGSSESIQFAVAWSSDLNAETAATPAPACRTSAAGPGRCATAGRC